MVIMVAHQASKNFIPILGFQSRDVLSKVEFDWGSTQGVRETKWRSDYFYTLEATARSRYVQKTKLCDGIDPYCLKKSDFSYNHDDFIQHNK